MSWTITPQTKVPVDPQYGSVSLLLHGNGINGSTTITDNSPTPKTVTAFGNAQISTAQSKFGGASIAFNGVTPTALTVPITSDFWFDSGNFTIELWVRYNTTTGNQLVVGQAGSGISQFIIYTTGASLVYYLSSGGTSWEIANGVSIGTVATGQWYHVALVRNGTTFTPYLNGTAGTTSTSSAALFRANTPIQIGSSSTRAFDLFNGYIDDLRITKGIARYTANFTPPAAPFPDI
jgi:hypothetical protein